MLHLTFNHQEIKVKTTRNYYKHFFPMKPFPELTCHSSNQFPKPHLEVRKPQGKEGPQLQGQRARTGVRVEGDSIEVWMLAFPVTLNPGLKSLANPYLDPLALADVVPKPKPNKCK